ncbi:hypothetical protein CROQUDRAFT_652459 [Cronartium quercuum f. sp. fusiforme G11]|uniref:RRM domain-containing protein n=1 Tax=Cronartium quercuum f. sp. fusiforme G11 TaxID=708437 RepID=A0A9P6NTW4_9BASI|nr:hypothetical protein CROQUDRAFT_652459 [Cronartium quercuum f. sp. fusiforme G11]
MSTSLTTPATNADQHDLSTTTTLFISRLPNTITSEQLTQLASAHGPVRNAFVVNNKSIGYIRYVIRSDAETAIKNGFENIKPRPLIDWAKPRPSVKDRKLAKEQIINNNNHLTDSNRITIKPRNELFNSKNKTDIKKSVTVKSEPMMTADDEGIVANTEPVIDLPTTTKTDSIPKSSINNENKNSRLISKYSYKRDPNANRTLILQGLPPPLPDNLTNEEDVKEDEEAEGKRLTSDAMTKAIYKRVRKLSPLESVIYPSPISKNSAELVFKTPNGALTASERLHLHVFKSNLITTVFKSRWMSNFKIGPAHSGGRLIIRNLDFKISINDLRLVFGKFGPIQSIEIHKGFGFIWMVIESDAKKAMENINGTMIKPGISKEFIENESTVERKSVKRKRDKEVKGTEDAEEIREGRVVAVDWALGKKQYLEAEAKEAKEDESEGEKESDNEDEDDDDDDDEDDDGDDEDEDEEGSDLGTSDNSSQGSNDEPCASPEGVSLFIRNLSFEATEDELYTLFRAFGPVRYARIVVDPKTRRSRGTGFVCMWNGPDASKILELAKSLEADGFGQGPIAANGLPSLLQPDPSSGIASQLSLHGRVLGVSKAVTKIEAEKLRLERDRKGAGKDKRNLYLMKEGLVLPNTQEASKFDPVDLTARQASFDERKSLLRTNLSLYISRTRLSVRQIPTYVSDRTIKRLARHALACWRQEVKAGKRPELSPEERRSDERPKIKDEKEGKVRQAKVVRDDGKSKKSKGYGFVELVDHSDALRVVRWVSGNAVEVDKLMRDWTIEELEGVDHRLKSAEEGAKEKEKRRKRVEELKKEVAKGTKSKKLIMVEFAIENAQTVKKRLERREKMKEKEQKKLEMTEEGDDAEEEKEEKEEGQRLVKRHKGDDKKGQRRKPVAQAKAMESMKEIVEGKEKLVGRVIGKKRKIRRERKQGK